MFWESYGARSPTQPAKCATHTHTRKKAHQYINVGVCGRRKFSLGTKLINRRSFLAAFMTWQRVMIYGCVSARVLHESSLSLSLSRLHVYVRCICINYAFPLPCESRLISSAAKPIRLEHVTTSLTQQMSSIAHFTSHRWNIVQFTLMSGGGEKPVNISALKRSSAVFIVPFYLCLHFATGALSFLIFARVFFLFPSSFEDGAPMLMGFIDYERRLV